MNGKLPKILDRYFFHFPSPQMDVEVEGCHSGLANSISPLRKIHNGGSKYASCSTEIEHSTSSLDFTFKFYINTLLFSTFCWKFAILTLIPKKISKHIQQIIQTTLSSSCPSGFIGSRSWDWWRMRILMPWLLVAWWPWRSFVVVVHYHGIIVKSLLGMCNLVAPGEIGDG